MAAIAAHTQTTIDFFGYGTNRFGIEFVEIGDPGNPNDVVFTDKPALPLGVGAVNYVFRLARYETSEFLVAQVNGLSGLGLTTTYWGNDYPAGKFGLIEQVKYANWLNLVSGHHPAYSFSESGDWQVWPPTEAWQIDGENLYRHKDSFYFVPTVHEWHKGAFWDPTARRYWLYPTGSNDAPLAVTGGVDPQTAVYRQPVEQGPAVIYQAGGASPFGTIGQGGNIHEILETAWDGINDAIGKLHFMRGGWWIRGEGNLRSSGSDQVRPWLIEEPFAGPNEGGSHEGGGRLAALPPLAGDSDGDGVGDREERIAGTDPWSADDRVQMSVLIREGEIEVRFPTMAAPRYGYLDSYRYYALEVATGMPTEVWATVPGHERILGEGQEVVYREPAAPDEARYFRLRIWLEAKLLDTQPVRGELSADSFGEGLDAFTIEFVTVRNEGNPYDETAGPYPMGAVVYPYRIAKFEVSEDTVSKANTLGGLGLTFSGVGTNKPATMMTFLQVARFVNWLNTSKGFPPAYNLNERGAWGLWPLEEAWTDGGLNLYRHRDAMYFVPSADEWYKAAYYNGERYFTYATGGDQEPLAVPEGRRGGSVVYRQLSTAVPADVDHAGGLSHYGTMGQAGNVAEWVETAIDGFNHATDKLLQVRGGSWTANRTRILGSSTSSTRATGGGTSTSTGFRIASRLPPEP